MVYFQNVLKLFGKLQQDGWVGNCDTACQISLKATCLEFQPATAVGKLSCYALCCTQWEIEGEHEIHTRYTRGTHEVHTRYKWGTHRVQLHTGNRGVGTHSTVRNMVSVAHTVCVTQCHTVSHSVLTGKRQ